MANLNRPGTIEFAVRHAMDNLGAKRVAKVLGCSVSTLYKATNPNQPTRGLPTITVEQAMRLATLLQGRSGGRKSSEKGPRVEHFSDCFRLAGWVWKPSSDDVHYRFSDAIALVGKFARTLTRVTDEHSDGGELITAAEFADISRDGRIAMSAIADVVHIAFEKSFSDREEYLLTVEAEIAAEIAENDAEIEPDLV